MILWKKMNYIDRDEHLYTQNLILFRFLFIVFYKSFYLHMYWRVLSSRNISKKFEFMER